ncbi:hypothetical protein RUND412_000080 [Rhizina undulata]
MDSNLRASDTSPHPSQLKPQQPHVHIPIEFKAQGEDYSNFTFLRPSSPVNKRKKLILCFDGTGNKFKGNDGDSNISKIFRMLDRCGDDQSGIGTYVTGNTLSRTSTPSKFKSWFTKAMDAAVGTSFDQHVMGGYKFLMRYYSPGDDIYLFGFSRGAYTARFLAEMLDHVGLVSQGNEEMVFFAWKTFSNWQLRTTDSKKKKEMHGYMQAFRETFSRPVRRVRFLGLFDTVNAVPRFENAFLKRSRGFPYTARTTAHVIRHAVGIDERRARFRQDLVEKADHKSKKKNSTWKFLSDMLLLKGGNKKKASNGAAHDTPSESSQRELVPRFSGYGDGRRLSVITGDDDGESVLSQQTTSHNELSSDDENAEQDIEEVWFPGCHADIGGGWDLADGESPLSHGPLVWMVREARKAGVLFDKQRMIDMKCWIEEDLKYDDSDGTITPDSSAPRIEVSEEVEIVPTTPNVEAQQAPQKPFMAQESERVKRFLQDSFTQGRIHDCLEYNNGLSVLGVLGWKIMEYLPIRRMDLTPDGIWKPIVWPLPRGEVRHIPENVKIHHSVVKRMEVDESYRPGNLLLGGTGGRGVRKAPLELGIGEWVVIREKGSVVGEVLIKKHVWEKQKGKGKGKGKRKGKEFSNIGTIGGNNGFGENSNGS